VSSIPPLIAVVDDEAPVRAMLGRVLRLADYEVAAFGSGEEFLNSLVVRVPACVILDVHMPGLSGFDAAARLRSACHEVPIVFITASDDAALDRAATAAGDSVLLRKPFPADSLLTEINAALRRKPAAAP
jgi:FixJ family two-component response regulator